METGGKLKKTLNERMQEFCIYHRDGDGECNAILLKKYAEMNKLSVVDCFDLAFFFSVTYCCESGIILFLRREKIKELDHEYIQELKKDMIFQSDRKYVKMRNCFEKLLCFWRKKLQKYNTSKWFYDGVLQLEKAIKDVETWYMFGRFSAFLFLETYATLLNVDVSNTTIDWKNGDTATSGLLNLYGRDEEASYFDREGVLMVSNDKMDDNFQKLVLEVERSGGDANTTKLETSLCAYRKFYKGTRYNGYYLDRMLEELKWYEKNKKEYNLLTKELYEIRLKIFYHDFLGELHGWNGIRKEAKKLYRDYGII